MLPERVLRQITIDARYSGYLAQQMEQAKVMQELEAWTLPAELDYSSVKGLSNEARQKLAKRQPTNLGQAARIDGVTPAEIAMLQLHAAKRSESQEE